MSEARGKDKNSLGPEPFEKRWSLLELFYFYAIFF
ncbi:Hypothetical protein Minf_0463 [Methylacidiphilum infernorum V4]|uniref:Uncharacterized protein n=1 Tax=Methylacidiphilum infernorum (isolate V4) TaxID=481448 RepID=B3DYZ9_METI4|nr:Hypothetical protein Minf_0463 [Methylacidiphilum infernorum V4]